MQTLRIPLKVPVKQAISFPQQPHATPLWDPEVYALWGSPTGDQLLSSKAAGTTLQIIHLLAGREKSSTALSPQRREYSLHTQGTTCGLSVAEAPSWTHKPCASRQRGGSLWRALGRICMVWNSKHVGGFEGESCWLR